MFSRSWTGFYSDRQYLDLHLIEVSLYRWVGIRVDTYMQMRATGCVSCCTLLVVQTSDSSIAHPNLPHVKPTPENSVRTCTYVFRDTRRVVRKISLKRTKVAYVKRNGVCQYAYTPLKKEKETDFDTKLNRNIDSRVVVPRYCFIPILRFQDFETSFQILEHFLRNVGVVAVLKNKKRKWYSIIFS